MLIDCRKGDMHVGNATVHMCHLGSEFRHLVHLVDTFACEVVYAVKVGCVHRHTMLYSRLCHRDYSLEDCALSVLNPLTHGVKVCREVYRCRENTFAVLTFAFSIKLFPPFGNIMKLGIEVDKNLYFLSAAVKGIAKTRIGLGDIGIGCVKSGFLHFSRTGKKFLDVMTRNRNRKKTYRGEH